MSSLITHRTFGRKTFALGFIDNPPSANIYRNDQLVPDYDCPYVAPDQIRRCEYDNGDVFTFKIPRVGKSSTL